MGGPFRFSAWKCILSFSETLRYRQTEKVHTLKRTLTVVGALLLVSFFLGYAAILLLVRTDGFRARVQSELSKRTGYEVRIDELRLSPWLSLTASGVSAAKGERVLFQGKRIVCLFLPVDLFYGKISRLSIERPLFRLSLRDLFASSGKMSWNVSLGSLNIEDAEFVLETGQRESFTVSSVFLNARGVSIGAQTGLRLRAHLPGVNGNATVSVSGGAQEKHAAVVVTQGQGEEKPPAGLLPELPKEKTVFEARFQMKAKENGAYEIKGSGAFRQFQLGPEKIEGEFTSLVELDAQKGLLFSVGLKTPRIPAKFLPAGISLAPGPARATLKGGYSGSKKTLTLPEIKVALSAGTLEGGGAIALGEKPARLSATLRLRDGTLDPLKPLMTERFGRFAYKGKIAADLNLSGAYDDPLITGVAWDDGAKIEGDKFSVSRLSFKLPFQWGRSSFQMKAGRVRGEELGWGRAGETQLKIREAVVTSDLVREPSGSLRTTADFQFLEGGFSSPDSSKVGEHLAAKGRFTYQKADGDASFNGEMQVDRLELLWNKFFGDFKDQKPSIQVEGSYRKEGEEIRFDRCRVSLASVGDLEFKGWVQHLLADPLFSLEIRTDDLRQAGFYDFFIRDTFKIAYPILGQIRVGGKSNLAVLAQGSLQAFTVEGDLRLQQGEILERSGRWRVGPMALELPLKLRFPEALKERPAGAPPVGRLSIREIKMPSTTIPEIRTSVVLWNNSLRFPEPIRVSLFGGTSAIEGVVWKDVVAVPRDLSLSLRLEGLRLLELTQALGWYRFGGTLSGSIPEVRWSGDSLRSEGAINLNVFGGRVSIRGMEIEKPLSPLRSIRMDVGLEGLDLEQASETFQFGRISGVLAGAIQDLVITQGQAAQFQADIRTVEIAGVGQWISVEALNKITVLSSGNEAGFIYGGLAGFFDFFRYSRLGFKAALKNDRIVLRGIESRDGKEYLVVGTLLPPTVNIIGHSQEVGFSELLRRLERIQKTGGPESSGRP